jgi:hypothetical protein
LKAVAALALLALLGAHAAHGQSKSFLVTDHGIGGITSMTPCTPEAVSAALDGLPAEATTVHFGDIAIPVLEVKRDGKRVLLAFKRRSGERISRAITYAPESVTSTGVSIGTPMAKVYFELPDERCRNGMERQKGLVFCPAPALDNVRFAFRCDYEGRSDALPPADVLAQCPLERIIWIADDY